MTPAEAAELVRHIMEDGFNRQDLSVVEESFVEDYVRHGNGINSVNSLAQHIEDLTARHRAFADARFEIEQIVSDGSQVAVRYTFHGIHRDTYLGIPATGRDVTRASAAFFRIEGGKVAEGHIVSDGGGLLAQLTAE
ncbi:MAG: ester cyclase [Acidimicrobiia bacterium]|nr:ester cyclase [Acidimicrobiia bacterium]